MVAIIGVLSTVGVPTFRKLILKARMAEAKVALGMGHRAESAFLAEWESYGNRLGKLGIEPSSGDPRYIVGSYVTGCIKPINDVPDIPTALGQKVYAGFPGYYEPPYATAGIAEFSFGRTTMKICRAITYVSGGTSYQLAATGVIAPGLDRDNPAGGLSAVDVWSIDQNANLVHQSDP